MGSLRSTVPRLRNVVTATLTILAVLVAISAPNAASAQELVEQPFEDDTWTEGLVDVRSVDLARTQLIDRGFAGGGLAVTIPEGGYRGLGPFNRLDPAPEEVWFRYHIRLTDWQAASTGKLPGLAGIYSASARGCIRPTASSPGWSARGMFGAPGTNGAPPGHVPIGTYLYHENQAGSCGDAFWWGAGLEQGRWHCVEGHVKMNTPGLRDGGIHGWLDGALLFNKWNIQFRRAGEEDIGVRHMWHNVYFGGTWPTPNRLSLMYDEVVVSTEGRIGCLRPFTDVGQSMHGASLDELHALGYLYGCGYRLACPGRELTRGEAAAFISRVLGLPPSSEDFFSDDSGSTFEEVINRLAEAGITAGCAPGIFCPDRTMTRAEFATMLARALGLKQEAPDAFSDDEGHWAENDINRFAHAGLTKGCGGDRFCPDRSLPRDEASAFFVRSLTLLKPLDLAGSESLPDWPPDGDPPPVPAEETD